MANEISVVGRLTVTHGGSTYSGDTTKSLDILANGHKHAGRQDLSTTPEAIDLGADLTWSEVQVLWVKNNSTTTGEDILLSKSSVTFSRIKPGVAIPITPEADGTAIQAASATGTPSIDVVAA